MDWFTGIAVYITLWWLSLFAVLPIGATSQHEADMVTEGTEPAAPVSPNMKKKLFITSVVAGLVWLAFALVIETGLISLERPLGDLTPEFY